MSPRTQEFAAWALRAVALALLVSAFPSAESWKLAATLCNVVAVTALSFRYTLSKYKSVAVITALFAAMASFIITQRIGEQ